MKTKASWSSSFTPCACPPTSLGLDAQVLMRESTKPQTRPNKRLYMYGDSGALGVRRNDGRLRGDGPE
jgi:hypothetical protein